MYSYQHSYHAGNFADVHKHLALIAILEHLQKKPTPFCVMDSHAGCGIYDLFSEEGQKIKEYEKGILKLYQQKKLPELAQALKNIVAAQNINDNELRFYPGSPAIIEHYLRPQDRAIFIEHHPQAISELKQNFKRNPQIHIHDRDALTAIPALLPFKEKRGLIFIDPSYEVKTEYQTIVQVLKTAYQRFSQGIFVLWYPLLAANPQQELRKKLNNCGFEKLIFNEWTPDPKVVTGMYGSGLAVINAPWGFKERLDAVNPPTLKASDGQASHGK